MKTAYFAYLPCLIPLSLWANVVVYTDSQHPATNLTEKAQVVRLDEPDRLQQQWFGTLSADPQQATRQAENIMHSTRWPQQEQQLVKSYQQVVHAWQLGLQKYPAVVFDGKYVVYGTADVAKATALYAKGGE